MHHDADADHLRRLLLRGTRVDRTAGVERDAPVATQYDTDRHRHQFLHLGLERACGQGSPTQLAEPLVDVGNHLAQCAMLRI
jgi:hypothetical protein